MSDFSNDYTPALRGTDAYGDLLLDEGGDLVLTSDANPKGTHAIGQAIVQALKTYAAEVFVDTTLGIPYYQQLLGQKAPASTWDAVLQSVVLTTPGVTQLTSWKSTPDYARRTLSISFSATTTSGIVDYADTVDLNAGG